MRGAKKRQVVGPMLLGFVVRHDVVVLVKRQSTEDAAKRTLLPHQALDRKRNWRAVLSHT